MMTRTWQTETNYRYKKHDYFLIRFYGLVSFSKKKLVVHLVLPCSSILRQKMSAAKKRLFDSYFCFKSSNCRCISWGKELVYIYLYDYFLWFKNIYCFITVTFDKCSDFRPSAGMETDEYSL